MITRACEMDRLVHECKECRLSFGELGRTKAGLDDRQKDPLLAHLE